MDFLLWLTLPAFCVRFVDAWIGEVTLRVPYRSHLADSRCFARNSQNLLSLEEGLALYDQNLKSDADSPRTVFVDGSWYHKGDRNGRQFFEQGHRITGSRYFDLMDVCNKDSDVFLMLPPSDVFARAMDMLQIQPEDHIVVYGHEGARFLPRVWFTFKNMGHEKVSILQASCEDWVSAGGPVDEEKTTVPYLAEFVNNDNRPQYVVSSCKLTSRVVDLNFMKSFVMNHDRKGIILDARGSSFTKGHMSGAKHLPYSRLTAEGTTILLQDRCDLEQVLEEAGIDLNNPDVPIVCTCGSGVSACSLFLALEECGRTENVYMYDGSWSEWTQYEDLPRVVP